MSFVETRMCRSTIRTIDKQRLKQYMGMMPDNIMARVDKALAISISLKGGHQNG